MMVTYNVTEFGKLLFTDKETYPGGVAPTGSTHPIESHIAAAIATKRITESQAVVYALIDAFGPLTDDQLKAITVRAGFAESTARARRSELARAGLIRKLEERGRSDAGNPCAIWEVAR